MIIRKSNANDINSIVDIHIHSFRNFFLTSLGCDFLKTYYKAYLKTSDAILLCAEEAGVIVGFAAAASNAKGFNSKLILQNLISFAWVSLKLMFFRPSALLRIVKNFNKSSETIDDRNYAELYSIAVSPTMQGMGVGKKLLTEIEKVIISRGGNMISLTTDYYDNDGTIEFYKTMGYVCVHDFISYPNRRMWRLLKNIY